LVLILFLRHELNKFSGIVAGEQRSNKIKIIRARILIGVQKLSALGIHARRAKIIAVPITKNVRTADENSGRQEKTVPIARNFARVIEIGVPSQRVRVHPEGVTAKHRLGRAGTNERSYCENYSQNYS
jgi:hypothetical protein